MLEMIKIIMTITLIIGLVFIVIGIAINILKDNDKGMTLAYVGAFILLIGGGITIPLKWIVIFLQNIT